MLGGETPQQPWGPGMGPVSWMGRGGPSAGTGGWGREFAPGVESLFMCLSSGGSSVLIGAG